MAAWEDDLRAVRQDTFDVGRGREPLVFIQRFYALISGLRPQIQRAWGPGGHVHVVDSSEIGGPGPRVSQSRIRLRNHGEFVSVELFSYANGASRPNRGAGLDRDIRAAEIDPLAYVTEIYRTAVDFLQIALNLDLMLGGSEWLYEHAAAVHFVTTGRWGSVAEIYRRVAREFAVSDSFESMLALVGPKVDPEAANGSLGSNGSADGVDMRMSVDQLQRTLDAQPDLENFVRLVQVAVGDRRFAPGRRPCDHQARPAPGAVAGRLPGGRGLRRFRLVELRAVLQRALLPPRARDRRLPRDRTDAAPPGRGGGRDDDLTRRDDVQGRGRRHFAGRHRHLPHDGCCRVHAHVAPEPRFHVPGHASPRPAPDLGHRGQRRSRAQGARRG